MGKKYLNSLKEFDKIALYEVEDAINLVKKTSVAKFDETIELHVRLGVDGRRPEMQIRGTVLLPHGTGRVPKILAVVKEEKIDEAKTAGADHVGGQDMIDKIQNQNWFDFDTIVTTPDMMGLIGRIGKILGPKGLMPNPKAGTVTSDVVTAIGEIKAGKVEYRLDKNNIVHCSIAKASFDAEKIKDNLLTLIKAIVKAKPSAAKGQYLKSVVIASTMGPGVRINPYKVSDQAA